MSAEKVVLAFSGGLDTSYCLIDLKKRGFEVHAVFVDTGGVGKEENAYIKERALALGADKFYQLDAGAALWEGFVVPLVWSHAKVLDQYPMLCSDRYFIVKKCLELCDLLETKNFAHGCTGMGNDQMRFDQSVKSLGEYEILAPIRDLQAKIGRIRDYEIKVLAEEGHDIKPSTSTYSINENLLGVTISGSEIDAFKNPAPETWVICKPRKDWPKAPLSLELTFKGGIATALNGTAMKGPKILAKLNEMAGAYGIGRSIYTGDVTIGLKGRIVFECPGIVALQTAHRALEDTVHTRWQNQFRHIIAHRWAELVYSGFLFEPHTRDLEAYLKSSQGIVNGTVRLMSDGGSISAVEVNSPHMLVTEDAIYAQSSNWSPEEAVGFIKLFGQSSSLYSKINGGPS